MTVLTIDTYEAISDFLPLMWPHYEKSGADVVGIERTNRATRWPKEVPHFAVGEDTFTCWAAKQDDPYLCNRWLGVIELFLTHPYFAKYDDLCLFEWDALFVKPLPKLDPAIGLCLTKAGGPMAGFKAPIFFHLPWWMDRKRAELILAKGRDMVAKGDIEHGSVDVFLGLLVHQLGLKWYSIPFYSRNRLDHPTRLAEAKAAIKEGAYGVHGVRDKAMLDYLFA